MFGPTVVVPLALNVVNAPVLAVVAPTVPLMLILAVPVRFVTVPLDGVPSAPLNNTGAPALPVLIAKAVAMPVPRPETPVLMGRPVQLVKVPEDGVPRIGAVSVGLVRVLLVSVSVVALPTSVSVASGSEIVRSTVCVLDNIVRVAVVPPAALNIMRFVASIESCTLTYPLAPLPARCRPIEASPPVAEM